MSATLSRAYIVQSIATASDDRMHVTLFEDNSATDAIGAPMGSNTVTLLMSVDEARQFFPGDAITLTLTST